MRCKHVNNNNIYIIYTLPLSLLDHITSCSGVRTGVDYIWISLFVFNVLLVLYGIAEMPALVAISEIGC